MRGNLTTVPVVCKTCGCTFQAAPSRHQIYCSRACLVRAQRGSGNPRWVGKPIPNNLIEHTREHSYLYVYLLLDPTTLKPRYVGRTFNPHARYKAHVGRRVAEGNEKACWIRSLRKDGLRPIMEIISVVSVEMADEEERFWVAELLRLKCPLLNQVVADESGWHATEHVREKMSNSLKGRIFTDEHRANIVRGQRGVVHARLTRWARNYDQCVSCGTTERKHKTHGLCALCYERNRTRVYTPEMNAANAARQRRYRKATAAQAHPHN